jgi:hypothetical protein
VAVYQRPQLRGQQPTAVAHHRALLVSLGSDGLLSFNYRGKVS